MAPDKIWDELQEDGRHLTAADRPSQYQGIAEHMGHAGIPVLNEWNERALRLFCQYCHPLFEKFPHLGAEYFRLVDVEVDNEAEKSMILEAWKRFDSFFAEFNHKLREQKISQNG